jgi:hypothetical protein
VACGALAACGSDTLNTDKAEATMAKELSIRLGTTVTVTCPNVALKRGATFDCEARTADGDTAPIAVVQLDDRGAIRYSIK